MNNSRNVCFSLVDDAKDSQIYPLIQRFAGADQSLEVRRESLFEEDGAEHSSIAELVDRLAAPRAVDFYGVIVDLRLDGVPQPNGQSFHGYGTSIAQEIRSRESFAGDAWCFPVVLLSMEANYERGFSRDRTGWDLFDIAVKKESLNEPSACTTFARRLVSLAEGYSRLRASSGATEDVLGLTPDGARLAPEALHLLNASSRTHHDIAQFVLHSMLEVPGPLIDEKYLLARLGVEGGAPGELDSLLRHFDAFRYRGVFCEGWPRWWANAVEQWWKQNFPSERPMRMLCAEERVPLLANLLGLEGLRPAQPISPGYSTKYWVACAMTGRPLDMIDAVKIWTGNLFPWQESQFVHVEEALRSVSLPPGMTIHPSEQRRVERLREQDEGEGAW